MALHDTIDGIACAEFHNAWNWDRQHVECSIGLIPMNNEPLITIPI